MTAFALPVLAGPTLRRRRNHGPRRGLGQSSIHEDGDDSVAFGGVADTTSLVGTPAVTEIAGVVAMWTVAAVMDDAPDSLVIQVTGQAGKEIRWRSNVETAEVKMPTT